MGRSTGGDQERQSSAEAAGAPPGYVDLGEAAARLANRHGMSKAAAAAGLRIAEALRATAAEYPDLTDEDAIVALCTVADGVRNAGVPRRR